ncbi:MAG: hypothetical protein PHX01_02545 [Clostridia bacterium]|nr:hypothetical protein [Clostridia bacterium]
MWSVVKAVAVGRTQALLPAVPVQVVVVVARGVHKLFIMKKK